MNYSASFHTGEMLDVITPFYNPLEWKNRLLCYHNYEDHMLSNPRVRLTVVECAHDNRPFELNKNPRVNHIGVRTKSLLWNKENTINIAISQLYGPYICWNDGDIKYLRDDWAEATIAALKIHDIIQPWSFCHDLGPNGETMFTHTSVGRRYYDAINKNPGDDFYRHGHSGYAWAAHRNFINNIGGLIDIGVLGSGDKYMSSSLFDCVQRDFNTQVGLSETYQKTILAWQQRAQSLLINNVGHLDGYIEHQWHGPKPLRGYRDRWKILVEHQFDPETDIVKNEYGVYEFTGNKPAMEADFLEYFTSRNEDIMEMA